MCAAGPAFAGVTTRAGRDYPARRAEIEEHKPGRHRIVISEIPYQQVRDRVMEKIGMLANEGRIKGIADVNDYSDLNEPVRIVVDVKRGEDPDVVLNQLYQFSPLQTTYSLNFLALVDGRPRELNIKELLDEFVRHRMIVIRRRTQFLLNKARMRKHTVEGLLLAHANIDEIIRVIRTSATQPEAKQRLMGITCPASMMHRALGDEGFAEFQADRGVAEEYTLTPVQADAILRMTLGQLVNLEQEKLGEEFNRLLEQIREYLRILSDEQNILNMIREDLQELKRKYADARRTEITGEEVGEIDLEDLIAEETMVVTISHNGYIKRTPASATALSGAAARASKAPATSTTTPSNTCSWPARTPTCCSSRTSARSIGKRCTACRRPPATRTAGRLSTCCNWTKARRSPIVERCENLPQANS